MSVFQGNQKLEEAIFTGLDYALWSRHDIDGTFMPFMMLYKDGQYKLIRVMGEGNPMDSFESSLKEAEDQYDQIVMCLEGRVPHEGQKQDAIIVKGFDTSHEHGLMFIQRFRGKESGMPFEKLGNPALVSRDEPLPVPRVSRDTYKISEEPYLSGMAIKEKSGEIRREIFAGHDNASILANHLFNSVLNDLDKNEPDFSGKFSFNFVPDTIKLGAFTEFIFDQMVTDLKNNQTVKDWESATGKSLEIDLKYIDENEAETKEPEATKFPKEQAPIAEEAKYASYSKQELDAEYFRIMAIPNAQTNVSALEDMQLLMSAYKDKGIDMPQNRSSNNQTEKASNQDESEEQPIWKTGLYAFGTLVATYIFRGMAIDAEAGEHYVASGRRSGLKQLFANFIEMLGPTGVTIVGAVIFIYFVYGAYKKFSGTAG